MKNRVTVVVGGLEYNILADDDPEYVKYVFTLTNELKEARTSWAGCKKIAEDLLRCFKEAYEEYGKTKK